MTLKNSSGKFDQSRNILHLSAQEPLDTPVPLRLQAMGHFFRKKADIELTDGKEKPFVEVFWGISGEGTFHRKGRPVFQMKSGDVFYYLSGETHHLVPCSDVWEYCWFVFGGSQADRFMRAYHYPRAGFHGGEFPWTLFYRMESALFEGSPHSCRYAVAVISEMLAAAGGNFNKDDQQGQLLREMIRLCQEHFYEANFNVALLAERLKINRSTVFRIFKQKMKITPVEYLLRLRIQKACSLLKSTANPISVVASQCGFNDTSYFCQVIRKTLGFSPTKFRNV